MNTLAEYLKIKKMSSSEEIGKYLAESIDDSSPKNFLISFLNYYAILKTIEKEQNESVSAFERLKAMYRAPQQEKQQVYYSQLPMAPVNPDNNPSHEALVIPLFPRGWRA